MHVIEDTDDRLILEDRPWVPGLVSIAVALLGAALALKGIAGQETGVTAIGAAILALGLGGVLAFARVLRLIVERDGAVTIATWRGSRWRETAIEPGETWARLYRQRSRGLDSYGIKLDTASAARKPRILMYARPFSYAAAREAVRRINFHLKEPV